MLPFDRKPWAKTVAMVVVILSFVGAICLALYFRSVDSLHISEVVGIFLLLLTIVPPNVAILMRRPGEPESMNAHLGHNRSTVR
ncbi:hypothetical protein [Granulicella arctica]|uniref:hypothetical protein n=1 Tax=Granulicella arctica TaxID=940613 RepID=UPI0021DF47D0|nr:hypothetical protein [Granulicella arctica]